jgi:uncharacterized membrane protein
MTSFVTRLLDKIKLSIFCGILHEQIKLLKANFLVCRDLYTQNCHLHNLAELVQSSEMPKNIISVHALFSVDPKVVNLLINVN